ncbi:unnamed protein product, partial [Ilex paraguariensis]
AFPNLDFSKIQSEDDPPSIFKKEGEKEEEANDEATNTTMVDPEDQAKSRVKA